MEPKVGTCPVCEGEYALLEGKLIRHDGIRGECFAVGYEPYEVSAQACKEYKTFLEKTLETGGDLEWVRGEIERMNDRIAAWYQRLVRTLTLEEREAKVRAKRERSLAKRMRLQEEREAKEKRVKARREAMEKARKAYVADFLAALEGVSSREAAFRVARRWRSWENKKRFGHIWPGELRADELLIRVGLAMRLNNVMHYYF